MDYRKGIGIVTIKEGVVSSIGKIMVYIKGEISIDFVSNKAEAMVEVRNVQNVVGIKRMTIPMGNVAGIVWEKLSEGHT